MMGQTVAGAGSEMTRKNMMRLGVHIPPPQIRMAPTDFGRHGSISDVAGGMGLAGALENAPHLLCKPGSLFQCAGVRYSGINWIPEVCLEY